MNQKRNIFDIGLHFLNKIIKIGSRTYELHVFLLKKMEDAVYTASLKIAANGMEQERVPDKLD